MRIAYDDQAFWMQSHGGVSRYFAELVRGLQQFPGIQPTVIAPLHINRHLLAAEVRPRVRGILVPRASQRVIRRLNAALAPAFWTGARFDVVHETYFSLKARGHGRVRVLTIYDMIHELFSQEFRDAERVTAAKRAAVGRADHVICISANTRRDAIRLLGVDPERSSVIHLAGSLEQHDEPSAAEGGADRPFVLYVGNRAGYKNFAIVLQAFASSARLRSDCRLVAFGGGPLTTEETDAIRSAGLSDRVHHVSGDDRALQARYRNAAAFVYPSRYEGFGIPPLEAMATGCPVVCSDAGSIAEVVGDAGAYFQPDDAAGLQAILERVLADASYASSLREKGFERLRAFSWTKCVSETLQTYERLLGRPVTQTGSPHPQRSGSRA